MKGGNKGSKAASPDDVADDSSSSSDDDTLDATDATDDQPPPPKPRNRVPPGRKTIEETAEIRTRPAMPGGWGLGRGAQPVS